MEQVRFENLRLTEQEAIRRFRGQLNESIAQKREDIKKALDERGFVFLDGNGRPFKCAMWGGKPWLFYWHQDNHWVSLRETSQEEIFRMPMNLSQEQQDLYNKTHDKFNARLGP